MAQHSNYAKDRDLMMEAYSSVQGIVPKTASTSLPRGYVLTEGHCSDEESSESVELGGKLYEVGSPDPSEEGGIVISIEKHPNGYMISAGVYSSPEDFVNAPDSATEGYGYALTLEGQPMDEDDLEDGEHAEDAEGVSPVQAATAAIDALAAGGSDVESVTAAIDQLAATLEGDEKVAAYENLRDYMKGSLSHADSYEDLNEYLNARLGRSEDAEGHHSSGSDDGECDECGGLGCDVCNGTGEQDEEDGEHGEEQPGEDFFDALDDVVMITGTENAHAVVGGMEVKLGRKLSPLETEHCHEMIQDDELPDDDPYKGEGDAEGYQGYR